MFEDIKIAGNIFECVVEYSYENKLGQKIPVLVIEVKIGKKPSHQ